MSEPILCTKAPENEIEFIPTPEPTPRTLYTDKDCGVKIISVRIKTESSNCLDELI
jgi:hypothetical protein